MPITPAQAECVAEAAWSEVQADMIKGALEKLTLSKANLWFSAKLATVKDEAPEWLAGKLVDAAIDLIPVPILPDIVSFIKDQCVKAGKEYLDKKKFAEIDAQWCEGGKAEKAKAVNLFDAATDGKKAVEDALKAYEAFNAHAKKFNADFEKAKFKTVKDYRKILLAFWAIKRDYCTMRFQSYQLKALADEIDKRCGQVDDYFAKNTGQIKTKIANHAAKNINYSYNKTLPTQVEKGATEVAKIEKGQLDIKFEKVVKEAKAPLKAELEKNKGAILGAMYASGWKDIDQKAEAKVLKADAGFLVYVKSPDGVEPAKSGTWSTV